MHGPEAIALLSCEGILRRPDQTYYSQKWTDTALYSGILQHDNWLRQEGNAYLWTSRPQPGHRDHCLRQAYGCEQSRQGSERHES